jgi:hypothetical protein
MATTKRAVQLLLGRKQQEVTVEVRNLKRTNELLSFDIWDGSEKVRGFVNVSQRPECDLATQCAELQPGKYMIRIEEYNKTCIHNTQLIEILKLHSLNPTLTPAPEKDPPKPTIHLEPESSHKG